MQRASGSEAVRLIHVQYVVRFRAQRADGLSLVCTRELEQQVQVSVGDAAAEGVGPDGVDVVSEGSEGEGGLHLGAGCAAMRIGRSVRHHQDAQRHSAPHLMMPA